MKRLAEISISDFEKMPVWQFDRHSSDGDDLLMPVADLPVVSLENCIVATRVTLASGQKCWAILGNINLNNKRATEHFLTLSVENGGKWFDLARYHDVDYQRRGPDQLATFLGLSQRDVFPIRYDISSFVVGLSEIARGEIAESPTIKLSQSELIELSLE